MKEIFKKFCAVFLMLALIPLAVFIFNPQQQASFTIYDAALNKEIELSEREYVIGALCSEMPPTFHIEALKAQAAAIYTNAFRSKCALEKYNAEINSKENQGYISKQTLEERWGKSFEVYYEKMCNAVDSVLGLVITYNNAPIAAAYHSMSGGKTEAAENVWGQKVPYLVAVESEGDTFSPNLKSQKSFAPQEVRSILKKEFPEIFLPEDDSLLLTEFEFSESGTVLSAMAGNIKLSGQKLREIFSLRSAAFSVSLSGGNVVFTVKGYGHAVGISQYGADFMARQGSDFKEILKHYYKDTSVMRKKQ